jgi:NAD(P)-dependent dehydrogenase (short-subunit alcohol dehydrogenase family)
MELADRICVVTGAASGIGRALCRRFAAEGARAVVVADLDAAGAQSVAEEIGGLAVPTDVSRESEIQALVARTLEAHGQIDLFCSNAGIAIEGGVELPDADWHRIMNVNFMAHLWAARAVLPSMLARGQGWLLSTASAAGLLTQIGSAPYAVSKHAAVALAEWLVVSYGDRGIGVSCLCPQGVVTGMLNERTGPAFLLAGALQPEEVAEHVVRGLREERFLILPHPEVAEHVARKAADPDRWLSGMRRLQQRIAQALGRS